MSFHDGILVLVSIIGGSTYLAVLGEDIEFVASVLAFESKELCVAILEVIVTKLDVRNGLLLSVVVNPDVVPSEASVLELPGSETDVELPIKDEIIVLSDLESFEVADCSLADDDDITDAPREVVG